MLQRDIWGDGLGAGAMERNLGRWAGRGSDGEVYWAMGRAWERWGGAHEELISVTTTITLLRYNSFFLDSSFKLKYFASNLAAKYRKKNIPMKNNILVRT